MEDILLYRYIASYKDVLNTYKEGGLYSVQKQYSEDDRETRFHPLVFFADNIDVIMKDTSMKGDYLMSKIGNKRYNILYKGHITSKCIDSITNMYIEGLLNEVEWKEDIFDKDGYYSQYYYEIESYYSCVENPEYSIEKFYIEYGYLNKMYLNPIDGYMFLANTEDEYKEDDMKSILRTYFEKKVVLKFDPGMYIASNWEKLNSFVGVDKCIYDRKAIKHYLSYGKSLKYRYDTFDMYRYLANDCSKIDDLMRDKNGIVKYDMVKCNPKTVSRLFIKNDGLMNTDKFDAVEFVKMYVSDDDINYDKNLSVSNAHIYFVKGYIKYDLVRWRTTLRYKILSFIRNRIFDGVRQTPVHIGKHFFKSCF